MSALHAEVHSLLARSDFVFMPFYLEHRTGDTSIRRQYCYYTQYAPSLAASACGAAPTDACRVLTPPVRSLYGSLHTQLELYRMLQSIGATRIGWGDVYRAYHRACEFKAAALARLQRRYREETASTSGIHVVLLGRPYTVLSRRMNKGIPDIFGVLGVKAFFQDMLPEDRSPADAIKTLLREVHWHYAATILRTAETVALRAGAYPVLVTSFRCSPDSFVAEFFKSIMDAHRKPYLILQLDEHGSSVGYETRIEAAVRSFQNHHSVSRKPPRPVYSPDLFPARHPPWKIKHFFSGLGSFVLPAGGGQPAAGGDRRAPVARFAGYHPPQPATQQWPVHPPNISWSRISLNTSKRTGFTRHAACCG